MQTINLIGNLGKDAEVKNFGGNDYAVFSLGVSEKKGQDTVTTWWNVYKYGTNEKLLPFLKKGTKVFISGGFSCKLSEKDGKQFINLNVNCEKLELISKPAETAHVVEQSQPIASPQAQSLPMQSDENGMPF